MTYRIIKYQLNDDIRLERWRYEPQVLKNGLFGSKWKKLDWHFSEESAEKTIQIHRMQVENKVKEPEVVKVYI